MASETPEADPQNNSWAEEDGFDGAEHVQPIQHSQHQDEEANVSNNQAPNASGDQALEPNDDGGEYDPGAVAILNPASRLVESELPRASPKPAAKKVKRAGGFLVGDSDDEGDTPTPASNGLSQAGGLQKAAPTAQSHNAAASSQDHAANAANVQPSSVTINLPVAANTSASDDQDPHSPTKSRHTFDIVAHLEERVKEDPRGDIDAWKALMDEYRRRARIDDARSVYGRFLTIFPQAADVWVQYLEMELELNNFVEAEQLFGKSLLSVPNVRLWTVYLDYIRRRNDLSSDTTMQARHTITQAYEFVIDNIGVDKDSSKIWADYVQFIRSAPGQIGGSGWQDQQKMDQLRKAYQRAICMPIPNVNALWKEYDQFEMSLNKLTGRKFLQEKSPSYMTARGSNTSLENITRGLVRSNIPRLPPAPGFDGFQEYMEQVDLWKKWIRWEKDDPLVLKVDEPEAFKQRILYCYKQALMALRFWPEMWVDAARWCFEGGVSKDGKDIGLEFLLDGIAANPESVLLALTHADRIESTYPIGEGDEAKIARGSAVRAPYNKVLDTLYDLVKGVKEREKAELAKVEDAAALEAAASAAQPDNYDEDEDPDAADREKAAKEAAKQEKIRIIQQGFAAQIQLLSRTISFVWIALVRAMRRIQGKGKLNDALGGFRQIFGDARQRGRLTSDVYVAVAHLEWNVYRDPVGTKLFERGAKLFPEDEYFMLEYLKHLHTNNDTTNARVVFETCVNKLTQTPELVPKARPLYKYFHRYESHYGELSQIKKLEGRMAELFPDDPKLASFTARFSTDTFDPIAARIIISPAVQMRPKMIMQSIERPPSTRDSSHPPLPLPEHSPRPQFLRATNSPKRPLLADDDDNRPRKMARGESPLKGAAGRRLDQQRRNHPGSGGGYGSSGAAAPAPIPRDINFLLTLLPARDTFDLSPIAPVPMTRLIQETALPDWPALKTWLANQPQQQPQQQQQQQQQARGGSHGRQPSAEYGGYGYGGRDSPNPAHPHHHQQQRPLSPYRAAAAYSAAPYRHSPLRPDAGGPYEPPPPQYGAPQQQQLPAGFQHLGVVPPPPPQQQYQPPSQQQQGQQQYGRYPY